MTLTAHSLVAVSIAAKISNPLLGIPLVIVSHYLMDKIPHYDVMTDKSKSRDLIVKQTLIDMFLGYFSAFAALFIFQWQIDPAYFLTAVFASHLPDLAEGPYKMFAWNWWPASKFFYDFQHFIHNVGFDARKSGFWGIFNQVIICSAFLLWAIV